MDRKVSKELAEEFANKACKDRQEREEAEALVLERKLLLLVAEHKVEGSYISECKHKAESLMSDPDSYAPYFSHNDVGADKDWVDKKRVEIDAMDISEEDKKSMQVALNEIEELSDHLTNTPVLREDVRDKLIYYVGEAQEAHNRSSVLVEQALELRSREG